MAGGVSLCTSDAACCSSAPEGSVETFHGGRCTSGSDNGQDCADGEDDATYTTPEACATGSFRSPITWQVRAAPRLTPPRAPQNRRLHRRYLSPPTHHPTTPPLPPSPAPGRWTAISTRVRTPRSAIAPPWPAPGGTGHACSSWPPSPSPSALRAGARSRPLEACRFSVATTRVPESAPRASRPRDWRCSCSRRSPQLSQGRRLRYYLVAHRVPASHTGTAFALPTTTATAAASAAVPPMPTARLAALKPPAPSK